ncbi:hypothetical protein [Marinigracilibium pacificum]|uniref:Uncharacterized protein n=1 Tax=Marinigracilibium pacificum TaxID=2729599 RepID=A0A848IT35_9BACT|nr:hypothetical protein [Marinigracilibium pacificum]NMM47497.1 hypothetical protein [Marinigracilibium pacificum]
MKKLQLVILPLLFLWFTGCNEPVFIPDPSKPALPVYTEDGHNVAGAVINGQNWTSYVGGSYYNDIRMIYDQDSGRFAISIPGSFNNYNLNYQDDNNLVFVLYTNEITSIYDLKKLEGSVISLDNQNGFGIITSYDEIQYHGITNLKVKSQSGKLHINYVKDSYPRIISGTFGFDYTDMNDEVYSVYYGRFDFKVYQSDFSIY